MKFGTKIVCIIAVFAMFPAVADVIIYDNLVRDPQQHYLDGGGLVSDNTIGISHHGVDYYVEQWEAEDFVLQEGLNTITDIHWWGYYANINHPTDSPISETFTIRIGSYDNKDDFAPDSFFDVFVEVDVEGEVEGLLGGPLTGTGAGLQVVREYSIDLEEKLTLEAGRTYYISIMATTPFIDFDDPEYDPSDPINDWTWATTHYNADTELLWQYNDAFSPYAPNFYEWQSSVGDPPEMAFQLTGIPVPEPSSLLLLGMGVAGMIAKARRRRK